MRLVVDVMTRGILVGSFGELLGTRKDARYLSLNGSTSFSCAFACSKYKACWCSSRRFL